MQTVQLEFAGCKFTFTIHPHGLELLDVCYLMEEKAVKALMEPPEETPEAGEPGNF